MSMSKESAKKRANGKCEYVNYTVQPGDTLWSIAAEAYEDGDQWRKIYNANRNKLKDALKSFKPGIVLTIPAPLNEFCATCGVRLNEKN